MTDSCGQDHSLDLVQKVKALTAKALRQEYGFDMEEVTLTFFGGRQGVYCFGTGMGMGDEHVNINIIAYDFGDQPDYPDDQS